MTEIAVDETRTDIVPGQVGFNSVQRAMLSQLGLSDAPEGDLLLFAHVCQKSGLDPFRKEIYMIGRNTQVTRWVPNAGGEGQHKETRWETVYTIQTGIQGLRKRAREIADGYGERISFRGPYWCGQDGQWRDAWTADEIPAAAKYEVIRDDEPVSAVCHYAEYVQTVTVDGQTQPNSMWKRMPRNQLAKCAEAAALQRAFPDELSGLQLDGTAETQIIDETGEPSPPSATASKPGGKGVEALRARAQQQSSGLTAGKSGERAAAQGMPPPDDTGEDASLVRDVIAMLVNLGVDDVEDRKTIVESVTGKDPAQTTVNDLRKTIAVLSGWKKLGTAEVKIREILNTATLTEEGKTDV